MLSLRRRLLVGTALGAALCLGAAGAALYYMMRASLLAEFDAALRDKIATLSAMIELDEDGIDLEFTEAEMVEFRREERPEYFQVWDRAGRVVDRSPSLDEVDLPRHQTDGAGAIHTIVLPDGRRGRILAVDFTTRVDAAEDPDDVPPTGPPQELTIALARDLVDIEHTLANLRFTLVLVGAAATLATLGVLGRLIRIGLRPVERIAGEISRIDERRLGTRVGDSHTPLELRPVTERLNTMLERLAAAFVREKTLTADVAHELRTPLAGLRTTLEVALARDRDEAAYREALSDCLVICVRLQRLVEYLLSLARLDAGRNAIKRETTTIQEILEAAWNPLRSCETDKRLTVHWTVEDDLRVDTDPEKLATVVKNILENAMHYVNAGGTVSIEARRGGRGVTLKVSNTGCDLMPDQVLHVFERFWRADSAREGPGTHCGLGLSLCKTIMGHLGGAITADATRNGTFTIVVTL